MDKELVDFKRNYEIPAALYYSFVIVSVLGTISFLYFNLFGKR